MRLASADTPMNLASEWATVEMSVLGMLLGARPNGVPSLLRRLRQFGLQRGGPPVHLAIIAAAMVVLTNGAVVE